MSRGHEGGGEEGEGRGCGLLGMECRLLVVPNVGPGIPSISCLLPLAASCLGRCVCVCVRVLGCGVCIYMCTCTVYIVYSCVCYVWLCVQVHTLCITYIRESVDSLCRDETDAPIT